MVGGGSAGHVVPALPVMAVMQQQGARVSFVGTRSGLEEELVAGSGADFFSISTGKLRRYLSWQNLLDVFRIVAGVFEAWALIGRLRPHVVFSKGGFVAFPVVVAAWFRRVPVVAHESDLTPGLSNRLCKPFIDTLCVSFPETRVAGFNRRVVHSGTPLRPELLAGDASAAMESLAFEQDRPILLVTGGSLGAQALNQAVRDGLEGLTQQFNVVHVCGAGKLSDIDLPGYRQFEYVTEGWGDLIAAADVVVSRAGANALFELMSLNKVCLLVPLSAQASRGDQIDNARWVQARGMAHVLAEEELDGDSLAAAVNELLGQSKGIVQRLEHFESPDAATIISSELGRVARVTPVS